MHRRRATKMVGGRALRRNNAALSPSPFRPRPGPPHIAIERDRPGPAFQHLLRIEDINRFVGLLPDWEELSRGLDAIWLAPGSSQADGWWRPGVVAVCAWTRGLWRAEATWYRDAHADIYERLGVQAEPRRDGVLVRWTAPQARAYQLLHILLHELGHHHDQMTNRSRRHAARGEPYAERYARRHERRIWDAYLDEFGLD